MAKTNTNFKVGHAYYIQAHDHALGTKEIITIEVMGWVLEQTDLSVTCSWWLTASKDKDIREDNQEPFVILKSAILKKKALSQLPKAVL